MFYVLYPIVTYLLNLPRISVDLKSPLVAVLSEKHVLRPHNLNHIILNIKQTLKRKSRNLCRI
jgi:hypothetical protein